MSFFLIAAAWLAWGGGEQCGPIVAAITHVESRGNTFAIGSVGERGLMQVRPRYARIPGLLLHVPALGREEGCRILQRWQSRARRRCEHERRKGLSCHAGTRALAAYNAGNPGLHGESSRGNAYARKVLRMLERP